MVRQIKKARILGAGAIMTAVLLALTGCIGQGAAPGQKNNDDKPVSTTVPSGHITLTFTDSASLTGPGLVKAFEALHPNVTIKYAPQQYNDYVKSINLRMTSNDPPDIAVFQGSMNSLITGGYLLDLTQYEKAYGWDGAVSKAALDQWRFSDDAKRYGEGKLYAVPGEGLSIVSVWYNRVQAKKAGISIPPSSISEFEADLKRAKDAGLQAINVGALDTGAMHLFYTVLDAMCPVADMQRWVFGTAGSNIDVGCARAAAQKIIDWTKAGYIPKTSTGLGEDDSAVAWANGEGVFTFNGNWNTAAALKGLGGDAGFFLLVDKGHSAAATGASGGYVVSSKTKHPETVAAFLNFMTTAKAAMIQIKGGLLPVHAASVAMDTPLQAEIGTAYQQVSKANGMVQFMEYAAPDMGDTLTAGLQSLILGRMTAAQFTTSLQQVWDAYHE